MQILSKVRRQTVTDTIIEQVAERIREGSLRAGDVVPNELQLAEQLGVGRSSVREALKALQAVGIVDRGPEGTVVSQNARVAVLHQDLRDSLITRQLDFLHLFEARRILEGEITALAAERLDGEGLAELQRLAADMQALPAHEFDTYFLLDMRFHHVICEAAANPVFAQVWSLIHQLIQNARQDLHQVPGLVELSNDNHVRLLEALAVRDPERARRTVHEALEAVETLILSNLREPSEGTELP